MNRFGILTFSPSLLFLVFLVLIPVIWVVYLSLFEVSIFEIEGTYVGLENYVDLLTDEGFLTAIWRGVIYATGSVVFQLIVGLTLALALNSDFTGSSIARTITIFPYLVPLIGMVLMWRWMLSPTYGVVNYFLESVGLVEGAISFFSSTTLAMPSVIVVGSWKYTSFVTLVLLARLQAIDERLYEQAKTVGATPLQMFRHITIPNLTAAIQLVVLLRAVWMFNKFSIIWLFTHGGPLSRTTTLPVIIYETTFSGYDLGRGAAGSIILFAFLIVFAIAYFWYFEPSAEIETSR